MIVRYATVECDSDECGGGGAHECYGDGLELSDEEAREIVADLGWTSDGDRDLCPMCSDVAVKA